MSTSCRLYHRSLIRVILTLGFISVVRLSNAQNSTDTCVKESAILNADTDILAANSAFQAESISSLQEFTRNCNLFERRCAKDLSVLPSAVNLTEACLADGGQIAYKDTRLKCQGSVNGIPIPGGFKVAAEKFPVCIGLSCDPENLPSEISSAFSTLTDTATSEIQNVLGDSITCEDSAGGSVAVNSLSLAMSFCCLLWMIL